MFNRSAWSLFGSLPAFCWNLNAVAPCNQTGSSPWPFLCCSAAESCGHCQLFHSADEVIFFCLLACAAAMLWLQQQFMNANTELWKPMMKSVSTNIAQAGLAIQKMFIAFPLLYPDRIEKQSEVPNQWLPFRKSLPVFVTQTHPSSSPLYLCFYLQGSQWFIIANYRPL